MKTHREMYPEQYSHPLVGKRVMILGSGEEITVARVVNSQFGQLVIPEHNYLIAYAIGSVKELDDKGR